MAKLSKKEQSLLESLQKKVEAPDLPDASRVLNFNIDLGDPEQVKRALSLGLIGGSDDDDDDPDVDPDDDPDPDDAPRRGGYFKDKS